MIKKGEINIGDFYYTIGGDISANRDVLYVYKFKLTGIKENSLGNIYLESNIETENGSDMSSTIGSHCYKSLDDIKEVLKKKTEVSIKFREAQILKLQEEIERLEAEKIQMLVFDRHFNPNLGKS